MRIVSFYPNPLPAPLAEGLSRVAEVVFWKELSEEQNNRFRMCKLLSPHPPLRWIRRFLIYCLI